MDIDNKKIEKNKEIKVDKTKNKKSKHIKVYKRILIGVEVFFAIIILAGALIYFVPSIRNGAIKFMTGTSFGRTVLGWFGKDAYNSNIQDKEFDSSKIVTNKSKDEKKLTGYKDILLIGIDSRTEEFDSQGINSDSMIVMHINNDTGDVKMISVYRDTYMEMIDKDGNDLDYRSKANAAYSLGGVMSCINTLNTNLDLTIDDYAIVNFSGVSKIIDALGGIDVTLTEDEVSQLNYHLADTIKNTGLYSPNVTNPGLNHLNGLQTTTYMRIRKTGFYDQDTKTMINDDFGRAARQRFVISKLVTSAKSAGLSKTLDVVDLILKSNTPEEQILKTSMSFDEITSMVPLVFDFKLGGGYGFPSKLSGLPSGVYLKCGDPIVARGMAYNVKTLHEQLYGIKDYNVSEKVLELDKLISNETGVMPYSENEE